MRFIIKDKKGKPINLNIKKEFREFVEKSGLDPDQLLMDVGYMFGKVGELNRNTLNNLLTDHMQLGIYLSKKYDIERISVTKEKAEKLIVSEKKKEDYIG